MRKSKITHCEQIECEHYIKGGCESCIVCGAQPYKINTECDHCNDCQTKINFIRWNTFSEEIVLYKELIKNIKKNIEEIDTKIDIENERKNVWRMKQKVIKNDEE
jgi:hypothetical protein